MPLRFLDFPAEIREQIYHEVLCTANSRRDHSALPDHAYYDFQLDILRANRQIYHEAKKAFQDNIFVKITTPWPEALEHISSEGKVPIVTAGETADTFTAFHLWVWIDAPAAIGAEEEYSMVICLEDLEGFTRTWRHSNLNHPGLNTHLRLTLTLQDPHVPDRKIPKDLQNRLLLPFGMVKDLQRFDVRGQKVLPSVKESLTQTQDTPEPTPEECLDRATSIKDEGNKLLLAGEHRQALQKYIDAFAAIHIDVSGRTRSIYADGYYIRQLESGLYKHQRGDYVRMVLRIKLVANVVQTYLKLEEYAEAHFWGKRSIILFRQGMTGMISSDIKEDMTTSWLAETSNMHIPAKAEMGKIFYRTALATRAMGKNADVKNLINAAAMFLPYDEQVQREKTLVG
ncbi:MAG: hypothetical protein Q9191_007246 [Dirinaria sp. TL-2023a]